MKDIVEIRWHGRGGQGAKTASLLLADAAFNTGKYVQGFPEYGPERMGAPITAYNRISSERSTVHSNIYFPDYVVVVDETLLSAVDVTAGLKKEGAIVINSSKSPAELRPLLKGYEGRVCTIDAGKISEEELALLTGQESISAGVEALHALGAALVMVTLGPNGCAFSNGHGLTHQPTYDTPVVDTTGSGDSFWGAFLSCLVKNGHTTRESLSALTQEELAAYCRFANGAGSICATHRGGIPALKGEEEIKACMEQYPLLETGFSLN